ncbi:MAG TPA: hypothetical protein VGF67_05605 [Ktedonobacteraceae bacterium]|jgi:hypothetical protein
MAMPPDPQASDAYDTRPAQTHQIYDVFVKSGTPAITFVEPTDFRALQHALAQPGRGVVIEGPSGVGKTTAVEKAIERLSFKRSFFWKKPSFHLLSARNQTTAIACKHCVDGIQGQSLLTIFTALIPHNVRILLIISSILLTPAPNLVSLLSLAFPARVKRWLIALSI